MALNALTIEFLAEQIDDMDKRMEELESTYMASDCQWSDQQALGKFARLMKISNELRNICCRSEAEARQLFEELRKRKSFRAIAKASA